MNYEPKDGKDVLVTPAMAAAWLKRRPAHQRPLSQSRTKMYASDMKDGLWVNNGHPIVFDRDGHLIDGQHRLEACVLSGCGFRSDVRTLVDPASYKTMDFNMSRTLGHVRAIEGRANYNTLAAAEGWLYKYRHGQMRVASSVTRVAVQKFVDEKEDAKLLDRAAAMGMAAKKIAPSGAMAFCYYVFSKIDDEAAALFFDGLVNGDQLKRGEPLHQLRERLIRMKREDLAMRTVDIIELTIRAWNNTRYPSGDGRVKKVVRGRSGSSEDFPTPV